MSNFYFFVPRGPRQILGKDHYFFFECSWLGIELTSIFARTCRRFTGRPWMQGLWTFARPQVQGHVSYLFECSPLKGANFEVSSFGRLGSFFCPTQFSLPTYIFWLNFIFWVIFIFHPTFMSTLLKGANTFKLWCSPRFRISLLARRERSSCVIQATWSEVGYRLDSRSPTWSDLFHRRLNLIHRSWAPMWSNHFDWRLNTYRDRVRFICSGVELPQIIIDLIDGQITYSGIEFPHDLTYLIGGRNACSVPSSHVIRSHAWALNSHVWDQFDQGSDHMLRIRVSTWSSQFKLSNTSSNSPSTNSILVAMVDE